MFHDHRAMKCLNRKLRQPTPTGGPIGGAELAELIERIETALAARADARDSREARSPEV